MYCRSGCLWWFNLTCCGVIVYMEQDLVDQKIHSVLEAIEQSLVRTNIILSEQIIPLTKLPGQDVQNLQLSVGIRRLIETLEGQLPGRKP